MKIKTILSALLCVSVFPTTSVRAQVNIIQAPANFQFVDMGYDANTDEVAIVGSVIEGTESLPTVFELNAEQDGFTTQTLASLPGATSNAEVWGISSDASRIAGLSSSSDSISIEGTTWLRSAPFTPTRIGFLSTGVNNSSAVGAWRDGVVGDSGGASRPIIWDEVNGIRELPGTDIAISQAQDVSSNGQIVVGFSAHEVFDGAAYVWDSSGINRLDDSIEGYTLIQSRASCVSPNGNYIGGEILASNPLGSVTLFAVIWEGANRTQRILADSEASPIQGSVVDVSDLGYAAGILFDADFNSFAFIENQETTNGVVVFEDWLEQLSPEIDFPFPSSVIAAIAEGNGKLFFVVAGENLGQLALVETALGLGDFDDDGDVDLVDLDQYNGNIGMDAIGPLEALDFDGDGLVGPNDFVFHYSNLVETSNGEAGTFAGDLNLDGTVNVLGDAFGLVSNLGNSSTSWAEGDFNGDGMVNVLGDAFSLVGNLGRTNAGN